VRAYFKAYRSPDFKTVRDFQQEGDEPVALLHGPPFFNKFAYLFNYNRIAARQIWASFDNYDGLGFFDSAGNVLTTTDEMNGPQMATWFLSVIPYFQHPKN
jgi:hypothetical protein